MRGLVARSNTKRSLGRPRHKGQADPKPRRRARFGLVRHRWNASRLKRNCLGTHKAGLVEWRQWQLHRCARPRYGCMTASTTAGLSSISTREEHGSISQATGGQTERHPSRLEPATRISQMAPEAAEAGIRRTSVRRGINPPTCLLGATEFLRFTSAKSPNRRGVS